MFTFVRKILLCLKVIIYLFSSSNLNLSKFKCLLVHINYISLDTLFITIITSFFISLVLSLQVVKELLYLNAPNLVSPMLAMSFIRELSPVLTSIIAISKVGSLFTAEIGTMSITEQIDAMFILGIDPVSYLFFPRVYSLVIILPVLNLFSLFTSFISSSFLCFCLYDISPNFFFEHLLYGTMLVDFFKSLFKLCCFGLTISVISCVWGINTSRGSKQVGLSTTSAVVTSLILIFMINFALSYFLFDFELSVLKVI
uniref:ABC transporter permease n=1 Tax=Polysiphonia sertularioides TaxID=945028 RepID=A0A1Z1MGD2_9FLOR|nr:hypothetical protein [Polysiphonia sertularioides]